MTARNGAGLDHREHDGEARKSAAPGRRSSSPKQKNQPQAAPQAQVGHNHKRSLDAIGADLRKLRNIFDSGELLVEARETCEHGEWLPWLDTYFDASKDTAERHMAAYRLSLKFRTVRNLKVPPTIIYRLADDLDSGVDLDSGDMSDDDLNTIVEALDKASNAAAKSLSVSDCEDVIHFTILRKQWGDFPDATLNALAKVDRQEGAGAIEQLKQEQPDSEEAADKIVLAQYRKHLEALYGGALPDGLDKDMLDYLDCVAPKYHKQVLAKLQAATQPLDEDQIFNIIRDVRRADQDGEEDHDDEDQDDDAESAPAKREREAAIADYRAEMAAKEVEAEQIAVDLIKLDRNLAQRLYAHLAGGESWLKKALGRGLEGDAVEEAKLDEPAPASTTTTGTATVNDGIPEFLRRKAKAEATP